MKKVSVYKAHELRMWIIQVIIPGILGILYALSFPQARAWLYRQWFNFKWNVRKTWYRIKLKVKSLKKN